uniref:Uncharacterized protein n=1 Tax=Mola mola TaxID=94237 RepID=A0A3Q4BIG8_MOLML
SPLSPNQGSSRLHGGYQCLPSHPARAACIQAHSLDPAVLDQPELKHIDQILVKRAHIAVATFIVEAVKHNADSSTLSSCLEELSFSAERTEIINAIYLRGEGRGRSEI